MKKKFLSLMMAAAVVATTSVSAFASSNATVNTDGGEVNVTITGSVNDESNTAPEGTISVTVPTSLAFSVSNTGDFEGTNLTVVNNGTEKVDIYAYQFVDKDGANGIEVKTQVNGSDNRSKVALNISGNQGVANFSSTGNTGVYNSSNVESSGDGVKVSTIGKVGETQNSDTLTLNGEAGKDTSTRVEKAIREEFTLRLKIKKASA